MKDRDDASSIEGANKVLIEKAKLELKPLIEALAKGRNAGLECEFEMNAHLGHVSGTFVCPLVMGKFGGSSPYGKYSFTLEEGILNVEDAKRHERSGQWMQRYEMVYRRGSSVGHVTKLYKMVSDSIDQMIATNEPVETFKL
jgi:hypothetical protein